MWPERAGLRAWFRRRRSARPAPGDPPPAPRAESPEFSEALLRRLRWTITRPLATRIGGDERSVFRGPGMELAEVREYQAGDDVRHIDWNITARAAGPYVRESLAERGLDVWLLLDLSASIEWGTARRRKRDLLTEFVAATGQILAPRGHRLGALLFEAGPARIIPPAPGRHGLLRLISQLRAQPRQGRAGPTDLAAALAHLGPLLRRRALVIVASDFLVPGGWQAALGRIASRHEVVAVRLRDPREGLLPDVGLITLEDPETGRQLTVDTADARLRARFAAAAEAQSARIAADLAACNVAALTLDTDADLLAPLVRFLTLRRRLAGGGRRGATGRVAGAPPAPVGAGG